MQLGHHCVTKVPQAISFAACVSVHVKATRLLPSSSPGLAPSEVPSGRCSLVAVGRGWAGARRGRGPGGRDGMEGGRGSSKGEAVMPPSCVSALQQSQGAVTERAGQVSLGGLMQMTHARVGAEEAETLHAAHTPCIPEGQKVSPPPRERPRDVLSGGHCMCTRHFTWKDSGGKAKDAERKGLLRVSPAGPPELISCPSPGLIRGAVCVGLECSGQNVGKRRRNWHLLSSGVSLFDRRKNSAGRRS